MTGKKTQFSAVSTMMKIKEKKQMHEFARKERDKRKRKQCVDQEQAQLQVDLKKNQTEMLQRHLATINAMQTSATNKYAK